MSDCIFCKIAKKEIPANIVWEDSEVIGFRDIQPQAPTHILVVPRQHIASLDETDSSQVALLGRLLLTAQALAAQEGIEGAYRTVINTGPRAGQSVFHIHLHLLGGRTFGWPPG